ncbi:hypothetical protein E2C01_065500 [Portunus trituberculatus]|uniref:Uncharacterized protein n=1 Tax=Portunus trituberculatus TaxID=210409 RepID=A0A5B7HR94_PORTR|nr:hypothetical protein [Portunus trituberculatus]
MFRVVFLLNLATLMIFALGMVKTPTLIVAANSIDDVEGTSSEDLSAKELKVDDLSAELDQIHQDLAALSEAQENKADDISTSESLNEKENRKVMKLIKKKLLGFPINESQEVLAEEPQELPSEDIVSLASTQRKIVKDVDPSTNKPGNRSTGEKKAEDKTCKKNITLSQIIKPNRNTTKEKEFAVKSEKKVKVVPSAEVDANQFIKKLVPVLVKEGKTDEIVDPKEEIEIVKEIIPLLKTVGKNKITVTEEVEVDIEIGFKTYREIMIQNKEDKLPEKVRGAAEDEKTSMIESNMITVAKDRFYENPKEKGIIGLDEVNETELT